MDIEFIEKLPYPYHLYHIKLINNSNKTENYDMSKVTCNAGRNILARKKEIKINKFELELLNKGTLKKNESIEGLICIVPSMVIATDRPIFMFEGKKIKCKAKINKQKKAGENNG